MAESEKNKYDKIFRLEERIKKNEWDIDAWNTLLHEIQSKPVEESRPFYKKLVKNFPSSVEYVLSYISAEKKAKNFDNVEKLFQEYLPKIYHIRLWKTYLLYVKERNATKTGFKEKVVKAYEYAIEHMGLDISSYTIWADYINFLRTSDVPNQYAEGQKTNAIRRVFNRAIITPMLDIEVLWRDYSTFEISLNNVVARRFIEEKSRNYMNARQVSDELRTMIKGLNRFFHAVPPQNSKEENKQVSIWKNYIDWEKSNPLHTDDQLTITKRVLFAYEQCLLCLAYHPDIWYEAATYTKESSKILLGKGYQEYANYYTNKASELFHRATSILKNNQLLGFAYADFEELRCNYEKVESIYNRMLHATGNPTLVYIQYSRFLRRSSGITATRELFNRAREDSRTTHHIYINEAFMEHFCTKDNKVARRIFELGIKKYMHNPQMVMAYQDYLMYMNQDRSTRALFERIIASGEIPSKSLEPIWDKYLTFESYVGDLASIMKLEKRCSSNDATETVQKTNNQEVNTARVIDRYKFGTLYPCKTSELLAMGYSLDKIVKPLRSSHKANKLDPISTTTFNRSSASTAKKKFSQNIENPAKTVILRPDIAHMLPFKPKSFCSIKSNPHQVMDYPPPPSISKLVSSLPPPSHFQGPYVDVEPALDIFLKLKIPEWFSNPTAPEVMIIDDGSALSIEAAACQMVKKRKIKECNIVTLGADLAVGKETPSLQTNIPLIHTINGPIVDVFKLRQQKRLKISQAAEIVEQDIKVETKQME